MRHEDLNKIIKASADTKELDTNLISDGYHTFGELYDHRIALFIALSNLLARLGSSEYPVWKSRAHHDGTMFEGWFIAGIGLKSGKQISYHLPLADWDKLRSAEMIMAPEWDGHTPADVVERLLEII